MNSHRRFTAPLARLGDVDLAAGMMAQVLLAGGLPRDAELSGDLRPADALVDCGVDEARQLFLGLVSLHTNIVDSLQQFRRRSSGELLRAIRLAHGLLVAVHPLHASGS